MRIRALVQEARWRQPGSGGEGAGAENKEERRGKLVGGCAEQREARVRWRFILRSQPPLATAPPSHARQLGDKYSEFSDLNGVPVSPEIARRLT